MTAHVTQLLDQLDEARAAGTPGEWATYWGDHIASGVLVTSPGGVTLDYPIGAMDDADDRYLSGNKDNPVSPKADAALIVLAVNKLPELTAAIRAVLDLHSIDPGQWCSHCGPLSEGDSAALWPCPTVQAITAAPTPAQATT